MSAAAAARRPGALSSVLLFTTAVAAVISSLGAPLIPSISNDLHVSLGAAQWSLTAALLAGGVSAPIMGRLGDGPRRRETLLIGLAIITVGGVVAALAPSLAVLVVGRAMQGLGLGLIPLTIAAARDHLPRERVPGMVALLSVCGAAGVGAGYPISGLIADGLGLSAAFWFGALVSGVALLCVFAAVPASTVRTAPRLDLRGCLLLTAGLVPLLVAIAESNQWGWISPQVLGLLAIAAALLTVWVRQQLRIAAPLVDLRLLRHPAVLTSDVCAAVLGVAMYMYLSSVTEFVQTPSQLGYGFSASVVVAGLCLVPFSVLSVSASRLLPAISRAIGERAILPLGSLVVAASGVFFALFNSQLWTAFAMMAILGVGLGTTFAAIPGLIVRSVPESETGSAMGFYQVTRYVGFSLGSALAAAILSGNTPAGEHLPLEAGYTTVFWAAAAICCAAAALAWFLPARSLASSPAPEGSAERQRGDALGEEDAELASAGLIGVSRE